MDQMDFGWEVGAMVLLLYVLFYYIMLAVNYLLIVALGGQIKKITDKIVGEDKKGIIKTALPFLISSTVFCLTFTILSFVPNINSLYNIPGRIITGVSSIYFATGYIGYIIGMTCLALTRYSFSTNWTVIGRLKGIKMFFNFILWTTIAIILASVWDILFFWLLSFSLAYPLLVILMTYLFLKWRNINRSAARIQTE